MGFSQRLWNLQGGAVLELTLTESKGLLYLHIFGSKRNEELKNATTWCLAIGEKPDTEGHILM